MTFSKEDKAAWKNSAVMAELEKIAVEEQLIPTKSVAWEDEPDVEEDVEKGKEEVKEVLEELEELEEVDDLKKEEELIDGLSSLSSLIATKGQIREARAVEVVVYEIKKFMKVGELDRVNRKDQISFSLDKLADELCEMDARAATLAVEAHLRRYWNEFEEEDDA